MADSIIDKLKQQFRQGSVLLKLIYINVAIFLLLRLTWVVLMLFNIDGYVILPFIEMPSIPYEFITHPWTLLTYMSSITMYGTFCSTCFGYIGSGKYFSCRSVKNKW